MHDPVERRDRTAGMKTAATIDHLEGLAKILQATAGSAPFIEIAHQHDRDIALLFLRELDDRSGLPSAP